MRFIRQTSKAAIIKGKSCTYLICQFDENVWIGIPRYVFRYLQIFRHYCLIKFSATSAILHSADFNKNTIHCIARINQEDRTYLFSVGIDRVDPEIISWYNRFGLSCRLYIIIAVWSRRRPDQSSMRSWGSRVGHSIVESDTTMAESGRTSQVSYFSIQTRLGILRHSVINYYSDFVRQKREAGQYLTSFLIIWKDYKYFPRHSYELFINIFLYIRGNAITFPVVSNIRIVSKFDL